MDAPAGGPLGISEPVPSLLQRVLKRAVLAHVREHGAEPVEPRLHVGVPGQDPRRYQPRAGEDLDLTLRTEVLETMARADLGRGVVPLAWLTRMPGPAGAVDQEDVAWAAAATCAGGELGVRLDLVVITRCAWTDPRSGVGRSWKRLRPRRDDGSG